MPPFIRRSSSRLFDFVVPLQENDAAPNRIALQRLMQLRAFVTVVGLLAVALLRPFTDIEIPLIAVSGLAIAVAASLILGSSRLRSETAISAMELLGHLLIDVILLVILLSLTGGVSNPLISYLLVLLAVSATLLPRVMVVSFAVGSTVIYTFFLLLDLSSGQEMNMGEGTQQMTFQLHLVGMWVIFVVSSVLITVFITRMAEGIRARELNLAKAREEALRSEQLIAIGTLAAGTAHALGTPLSTMSVLLADLDTIAMEHLAAPEVKEDISTLKQQVSRCRNSLTQLTRYYHKEENKGEHSLTIAEFAADIGEYLTNIHPAANIKLTMQDIDNKRLSSDPSIKHAVINIIENSLKATANEVRIDVRVLPRVNDTEQIEILISDDGPGIPKEVMENLGEPFISVRNRGMGLGIYLANASIQRLGGSIEMSNLREGGAQTRILLPLYTESNSSQTDLNSENSHHE